MVSINIAYTRDADGWSEPWCHGTVIGSRKLRESVAYGDGVGVSTEAAHDASGAIGHLSSGEWAMQVVNVYRM